MKAKELKQWLEPVSDDKEIDFLVDYFNGALSLSDGDRELTLPHFGKEHSVASNKGRHLH